MKEKNNISLKRSRSQLGNTFHLLKDKKSELPLVPENTKFIKIRDILKSRLSSAAAAATAAEPKQIKAAAEPSLKKAKTKPTEVTLSYLDNVQQNTTTFTPNISYEKKEALVETTIHSPEHFPLFHNKPLSLSITKKANEKVYKRNSTHLKQTSLTDYSRVSKDIVRNERCTLSNSVIPRYKEISKHTPFLSLTRNQILDTSQPKNTCSVMSVNEVIGSTVERIPLDTKETVTPLRYLSSDRIKKITLSLYPSAWKVEPCLSLLNNLCSDTPMDSNALPNTILWTEKYKPNKTSLLLGNAKGATYLRDWLCEQKIVSSKIQEDIKYQHTQTITSLMDSDEDFLPTQHSIRTNKHCSPPKRPMKITSNILLIVGQHGVGKTASVYAAAKEAGYDVFEMHPGMRRSKKDIMNIVGDMTENHQVKLSKLWKKNKNKEDSSVDSSELVDEVSLSRKNDESLFGLPERGNSINTTTNTSIDKSCTSSTPSHVELKSIFSLNPSKVKQSLILLEEVDVLFEQDSGFWSGVIALSKKSKRPIIMTCNDSTSVPFKSISVHKQLLMKPPSDNHLICYLHLICLSEGHLVEPYDLGRLVKSIGPDVRQLMCTLEMLCRHESTVSLKPLNDGRKYFYKWKNLFEDWLGYHDSKTMCKCSSLLHDPPHLYQNHPNYDIMNYMKSKMKICTPCLENKYKENTDANMNLVSLHQLMDLTSAVDTWNRNIDIKN